MGKANGSSVSAAARSINITMRTAHIAVMAVLVGGRLFDVDHASLRLWHALTSLTGVLLLVSEASHSRHWVYQARGLIVFAHVGAFALVAAAPAVARPAVVAALIIGSVGSHLPKAVRKWSFRHRAVVGD
jgi:hypothetical protein